MEFSEDIYWQIFSWNLVKIYIFAGLFMEFSEYILAGLFVEFS